MLIRNIISMCGYSPQSFGLDIEGQAASGTALLIREKKSFSTRSRKLNYWSMPLERFLTSVLQLDSALYHQGGVKATDRVIVEFPDRAAYAVRIGGGGRLPWLEQREMPCPPSELEVLPEFPGGTDALMQYWMKHLHYPESAQADSIEGRVIVSFIVEKDGRLTGLHVERSVRADLDSTALSAVRGMPRWMPGYSKGRAVRSKYVIPICYRLDKGVGAPIRKPTPSPSPRKGSQRSK